MHLSEIELQGRNLKGRVSNNEYLIKLKLYMYKLTRHGANTQYWYLSSMYSVKTQVYGISHVHGQTSTSPKCVSDAATMNVCKLKIKIQVQVFYNVHKYKH